MENEINDTLSKPFKFEWVLFSSSDIRPGGSAVLGGNFAWFYVIHIVAITLIITSLVSCAIVIVSIILSACKLMEKNVGSESGSGANTNKRKKKKRRMDFAERFPFYLAVADFLWGISHLTDHLCLLLSQKYPSTSIVSIMLSINLWTFLGYQQLMHACLAIYTYLRVVHGKSLNLGRAEWKLHLICGIIIIASIITFYPLDAFGPSGFWMLQDANTPGGTALGLYIFISSSAQALCTTLGYRGIQRTLQRQKEAMLRHKIKVKGHHPQTKSEGNYSTASECLATFVFISLCLYFPLSLFFFVSVVLQNMAGLVEPMTTLLIVITSNSSGWANAFGYFHNRRVKARRAPNKMDPLSNITLSTETGSGCSS